MCSVLSVKCRVLKALDKHNRKGKPQHQLAARPVPHACTQPYHTGSGSYGQLFRLTWAHQHAITRSNLCAVKAVFRGPLLPVRVHSQAPLSASSTQSLSLVSTASSPLAPLSVRSLGKGSVTSKLMLGSRFDQPGNSNGLG